MEQPRSPRYPFTAPAEVIVENSGAKIIARVTELSLHGCYLDSESTQDSSNFRTEAVDTTIFEVRKDLGQRLKAERESAR